MSASRVLHGRRGAAEEYSGRVFRDRSSYLSADGDSPLNLLIAADGASVIATTSPLATPAGAVWLTRTNLPNADHYFIPRQWTKGTIGRSFDQNRRLVFTQTRQ